MEIRLASKSVLRTEESLKMTSVSQPVEPSPTSATSSSTNIDASTKSDPMIEKLEEITNMPFVNKNSEKGFRTGTIPFIEKEVKISEQTLLNAIVGSSCFLVGFNAIMLPFLLPKLGNCIGAPFLPSSKKVVNTMFESMLLPRLQMRAARNVNNIATKKPLPLGMVQTNSATTNNSASNSANRKTSLLAAAQQKFVDDAKNVVGAKTIDLQKEGDASGTKIADSDIFGNHLPLSKDQTLLDFGSGDGRIVFAAAKRGYTAIGYEINPYLVLLSKVRAYFRLTAEERKRTKFLLGNIWAEKTEFFEKLDVVTVYGRMGDNVMTKIGDKLNSSGKKDLLVLSNKFDIPGWERKLVQEVDGVRLYDGGMK